MAGYANLLDWTGLDLNDNNDNASLVNTAIAQCAPSGTPIHVPGGKMALGSTIPLPDGLRFVGPGQAGGAYNGKQAFFHFAHSGVGFQVVDNMGARSISGINFIRTQPTPGPGWQPADHDWDLQMIGASQDIEIRDCNFMNPSRMIQVAKGGGRLGMSNVKGQPLICGIEATERTDVDYWDRVHLWPIWSQDPNVIAFVRNNAEGIQLLRCDNPKHGRIFTWGYYRALHVMQQGADGGLPTGTVNLAHFDIFGADNSGIGLLVDLGADGADLSFDMLYDTSDPGQPAPTAEPLIWMRANNVRLNVGRLAGLYTQNSFMRVDGTGSVATVGASSSVAIDMGGGPQDAEFEIGAGNRLRLLTSPVTSAAKPYGGAGIIETPDWRAYSPVVSAQIGALTSASATGRFRRTGKTVEYSVQISVANKGSAAGDIRASLPVANAGMAVVSIGRETAVNGLPVIGTILGSGTSVICTTTTNAFPGVNGAVIVVSGSYEVA